MRANVNLGHLLKHLNMAKSAAPYKYRKIALGVRANGDVVIQAKDNVAFEATINSHRHESEVGQIAFFAGSLKKNDIKIKKRMDLVSALIYVANGQLIIDGGDDYTLAIDIINDNELETWGFDFPELPESSALVLSSDFCHLKTPQMDTFMNYTSLLVADEKLTLAQFSNNGGKITYSSSDLYDHYKDRFFAFLISSAMDDIHEILKYDQSTARIFKSVGHVFIYGNGFKIATHDHSGHQENLIVLRYVEELACGCAPRSFSIAAKDWIQIINSFDDESILLDSDGIRLRITGVKSGEVKFIDANIEQFETMCFSVAYIGKFNDNGGDVRVSIVPERNLIFFVLPRGYAVVAKQKN